MDVIAQRYGLYDASDSPEWADKIVRVIATTGGGLVTGAPGVGKSKTIEALQTHLSTLGQRHVTCAYTHAAARLIGGSTIARLFHFDHRLHDA